jgi:hypothetical protein
MSSAQATEIMAFANKTIAKAIMGVLNILTGFRLRLAAGNYKISFGVVYVGIAPPHSTLSFDRRTLLAHKIHLNFYSI